MCFQMGRYPLGPRPRADTPAACSSPPGLCSAGHVWNRSQGWSRGARGQGPPWGLTIGSRQSGYQRTPGPGPWAERPTFLPPTRGQGCDRRGFPSWPHRGPSQKNIPVCVSAPGKSHRTIPERATAGRAGPTLVQPEHLRSAPWAPRPLPASPPLGPACFVAPLPGLMPGWNQGGRRADPSETKLCSRLPRLWAHGSRHRSRAGSVHGGACRRSGWQAGR